jgi:hypothetical protein
MSVTREVKKNGSEKGSIPTLQRIEYVAS